MDQKVVKLLHTLNFTEVYPGSSLTQKTEIEICKLLLTVWAVERLNVSSQHKTFGHTNLFYLMI